MYAITGAFGQTGLTVSQALLDAEQPIRMIVRRDDEQAEIWRKKGAEVVVADLGDRDQVLQVFRNVKAAYLMNPPAYFSPDLFKQAHAIHSNLVFAANSAQVPHVVALSSVGAQHATGTGNILTTHDFEKQLQGYSGYSTILRAANFMENWAWSLPFVKEKKILYSMFRPIEKTLPMVSARDISIFAAKLLLEEPDRNRVVELYGPEDYSPVNAANVLTQLLGYEVKAAEESDLNLEKGMLQRGFPQKTVAAFIEMFSGFNSGLIAFEGRYEKMYGSVSLLEALSTLLVPDRIS